MNYSDKRTILILGEVITTKKFYSLWPRHLLDNFKGLNHKNKYMAHTVSKYNNN
jgi:hypothetical protein